MPSLLGLGQGKRHIGIAVRGTEFVAAGGGDDDVLAAVDLVAGGRGVSNVGEPGGPKLLASVFVEGTDLVVAGAGAKDQTASRHYRAAVILRASELHALGRQF